MQAVLDAGHCALFYHITRAYFDEKVAVLTAVTLIVSPLFIFSMFIAGTETPFSFLNALFLFVLTLALMNRKIHVFFASGIVLGLATLCRAVSILLPFFLLPVFFVRQNSRKEKFLQYAIFFLGFVLTITPWIVRNYLVFHKFVPVQTLGGVHLYMAAPGASTKKDKITDWGKVGQLNSAERDQFFYSQAWKRIKQQPGQFLKGSVIRLGRMWYRTDSGRFEKPLLLANAVLIFFAIIGMVMCRKRWKDQLLFYVVGAYYVIVHMSLVGLVRYALPVIPLLTAFAMVPITSLIARTIAARQKNSV
jgi:4-amino-4-deoxy-L-arabinose transferase-like glycosyltransferase